MKNPLIVFAIQIGGDFEVDLAIQYSKTYSALFQPLNFSS